MKYNKVIKGEFIDRPNRFIAHVKIEEDKIETVHVKNTGRCRELLLPGARVILEVSDNPNRKTKYDLITVWKEGLGWVNVDSQAPNVIVKEWLLSGKSIFGNVRHLKPEYSYGDSRVDFYLECEAKDEKSGELYTRKILIEVKGCTLEIDGKGYFPDAPTSRGVKHLKELTAAVKKGYECYIAFAITMPVVGEVLPNESTDPSFATAFYEAKAAGVGILNLACEVTEDTLKIL